MHQDPGGDLASQDGARRDKARQGEERQPRKATGEEVARDSTREAPMPGWAWTHALDREGQQVRDGPERDERQVVQPRARADAAPETLGVTPMQKWARRIKNQIDRTIRTVGPAPRESEEVAPDGGMGREEGQSPEGRRGSQ